MNLGKETEILEFKKSTGELRDSMDDISSILNKHGKGKLYFGVKPNGEVIGQMVGYSSLDDVAKFIKNAIKPTIYPEINEVILDEKTCIEVIFSGSERPYSSYGRYFKRVSDRSEEMTPSELKRMMKSMDYNSNWENNLTKFGTESIDKEALYSYYVKAISCGRLEPLLRYDERELLIGLGLLQDERLTNAGYYLFSNKKPVVLKMATYVTDQRIHFSDIRRIEGNIYNLINSASAYVKEKISWRVELKGSIEREEIPEVPVEALREIIVNSFAHADYREITENEIDITPTMIEIYNPGEFPVDLNPEMFVHEKRKSMPRNKVILNTLYKCKEVEIFGSGFQRVYSICNTLDMHVDYKLLNDGFSFIFYRKNITLNNTKDVTLSKLLKLSSTDLKVLNKLKENPIFTREELAKELDLATRTIQRSINKLTSSGKIIRIGSRKSGYWEVIE